MERKLATVLFVDLVGSTALVSSSDPEVVRRRVTRFFEQVTRCVTSHGGIVEKFAGDAVMAAFGIPRAHEDDAERATRAGLAVLRAVAELGLEARVGVESGEVVADDTDSTFATGEAVNLAARLQQAAAPGELLVGPAAHGLAHGRVEFEEVGALEVKGRDEPIRVWRAVCPIEAEDRRPRSLAAPLVGRDTELALLSNTFDRAVRDRRAHLFTIYGEPGVGKSRLAREFVDGLEGAIVLAGRCLPYGEGITYWPLAEMVKAAAGISDDDPADEALGKLRVCCEDEVIADLLALASGVLEAVEGERSGQEIAWAARAWAEKLAEEQPVVLAFEDIHWAEEPLLELIEHLADWVRDSPLVLLCLARPELLDIRSGWGGGRVRATAIELEPLAPTQSGQLLEALLANEAEPLPDELRRELLEKTEGNPLFLEETIRMLIEHGPAAVVAERIPDTVQALIAARIDQLPLGEKLLLQRAAVIGRVFWKGSIELLSPELEAIDPVLDDLLLRDFLLREARSTISGEQAYRFKHVLIREVAYGGVSKSGRAELHERFAEWLHTRAGEELLEIRAYHLDQACALHAELDGSPPPALAHEAAEALEAAGGRALAREANRPARKLFLRAAELEPTLERRYLAARAAWRLADLPAVSSEMERVCVEAQERGEAGIQGRALTALAEVALHRDADLPKGRELAERALQVLDGSDAEARFGALMQRAQIGWWVGDLDDDERYIREALALAREGGRRDLEASAGQELANIYVGRLRLDCAEPLVAEALQLAEESGSPVTRAWALVLKGRIHSLHGELEEAEGVYERALAIFQEVGSGWPIGRTLNSLARAARRKGDLARAEKRFREAIRLLKPLEDRGNLCESQRGLAEVLVELGRIDEAERFALEALRTVGPHDEGSRATTRMALGIVRAAQGRDEEAERLLREALEIVERTDFKQIELEQLAALAAFLRERGREEEAVPYEARLAELRAGFSPSAARTA